MCAEEGRGTLCREKHRAVRRVRRTGSTDRRRVTDPFRRAVTRRFWEVTAVRARRVFGSGAGNVCHKTYGGTMFICSNFPHVRLTCFLAINRSYPIHWALFGFISFKLTPFRLLCNSPRTFTALPAILYHFPVFGDNAVLSLLPKFHRCDCHLPGSTHRGHAPPLKFHKPQTLLNGGLLAVCSFIDGSEKLPRVSLVCMCNAH
jgi:hypothetical protein